MSQLVSIPPRDPTSHILHPRSHGHCLLASHACSPQRLLLTQRLAGSSSAVRVGGKAVLTVPSELAYGADGIGQIPGDSALQFEVELLEVTEGEAEKKMFGFM